MSAQPCGCDPEAKWVCEVHRAQVVDTTSGISMRFVKEYDIQKDVQPSALDIDIVPAPFVHPPSHLDIESPLFEKRPHIWIQWKGTDVCCDVHCSCGAFLHFDGDFFYFFKCKGCGQYWEVGTHMPIYPVSAERAANCCQEPE